MNFGEKFGGALAPVVSVIIPAYNSERTIAACIRSIQDQTFKDWEVIIVDDGSTDNTQSVVRDMAIGDNRIILIAQENQKQAVARNHGVRRARGRYIALLDSDDTAYCYRLERQLSFMEAHPEITVLGGARLDVDETTGDEIGVVANATEDSILRSEIFRKCPFSTSTVMARSWFFKEFPFDSSMPPCEDHDLWLRSRSDSRVRFHNLPDVLVRYSRKRHMPWSHYWQIHKMYLRALRLEHRPLWKYWYAIRPVVVAVVRNPTNRK